jgi:hypothetical protein
MTEELSRETSIDGYDINYILMSISYMAGDEDYTSLKRFKNEEDYADFLFTKMDISDYKRFSKGLTTDINRVIDESREDDNLEGLLTDIDGEFCYNFAEQMIKKYVK